MAKRKITEEKLRKLERSHRRLELMRKLNNIREQLGEIAYPLLNENESLRAELARLNDPSNSHPNSLSDSTGQC